MQLLYTLFRSSVGFHIVFGASDPMPLVHCAREDLESHKNVSVKTHNTSNKPKFVQVCHYFLTLWRHRICTAKCRGLGCQMLHMTIIKPNPNTVVYAIIVFAIIIFNQQHMEVLTDWTTSLASSALHLKGLSQQETFLLNKKVKSVGLQVHHTHTHTHCRGFTSTNVPCNPSTICLLLH